LSFGAPLWYLFKSVDINTSQLAAFEVPMAVVMTSYIFWDIMPCYPA
jgi:hypothetical protein